MTKVRKIAVVTGARSEYGLLALLLKLIKNDPELQLQLIVTGMHLSSEFGSTFREIEQDGFVIDEKVEMLLSSDSCTAVTQSVGLGVINFAKVYERLTPDVLVVLGDRFEILAAVQAAMFARIPIAHIHGGETSEGAFDEGIRHAITKMSYWHFVAAKEYQKRVIQMGESPERVFNVGAPGLDYLSEIQWMSRDQLEVSLEISLRAPLFLVTYHPVTLADNSAEILFNELLLALDEFPEATVIFTYPNADTNGRAIIAGIDDFVSKNPQQRKAFTSLGRLRYLSLMRFADVVIGNSSSGLIETPVFKKATVNIGIRQQGRLKASSIVDVAEKSDDIIRGIQHVLSETFQQQLASTESLYGQGQASQKILEQLKRGTPGICKSFFDINHGY